MDFALRILERPHAPNGAYDTARAGDPLAAIFAPQPVETAAAGTTIVNAGDPALKTYQLVSGCVRICRTKFDGRRAIVEFRFGVGYFGRLVDGIHANAVEAVTAVELRRLPLRALRDAAARDARLNQALQVWTRRCVPSLHAHLTDLTTRTAVEKLARFLLLLAREEACMDDVPNLLVLPMSRMDIGDFLGLNIESVSRAFTRLKLDGYISIHGTQRIVIERPAGLTRLANV
jgi:CRP-like cAMP-binding protein